MAAFGDDLVVEILAVADAVYYRGGEQSRGQQAESEHSQTPRGKLLPSPSFDQRWQRARKQPAEQNQRSRQKESAESSTARHSQSHASENSQAVGGDDEQAAWSPAFRRNDSLFALVPPEGGTTNSLPPFNNDDCDEQQRQRAHRAAIPLFARQPSDRKDCEQRDDECGTGPAKRSARPVAEQNNPAHRRDCDRRCANHLYQRKERAIQPGPLRVVKLQRRWQMRVKQLAIFDDDLT